MSPEERCSMAHAIKQAFEEGYGSYTSACSPMTLFKDEWEGSVAKTIYDDLIAPCATG